MTTAQVVETSVAVTNSSFQNYTHPDDYTRQTTDSPGFKIITKLTLPTTTLLPTYLPAYFNFTCYYLPTYLPTYLPITTWLRRHFALISRRHVSLQSSHRTPAFAFSGMAPFVSIIVTPVASGGFLPLMALNVLIP